MSENEPPHPPDEEAETLLSNAHGTITAVGPAVLICECQGEGFDAAVRGIAAFTLLLTVAVLALVWIRAIPWPMVVIPLLWSLITAGALVFLQRRRRLHGRVRIDLERGEIVQEGRGFRRSFPAREIAHVTTAGAVDEPVGDRPGLEARWLVLRLEDGHALRLGKGPVYALGPVLSFLRRAGLEVR